MDEIATLTVHPIFCDDHREIHFGQLILAYVRMRFLFENDRKNEIYTKKKADSLQAKRKLKNLSHECHVSTRAKGVKNPETNQTKGVKRSGQVFQPAGVEVSAQTGSEGPDNSIGPKPSKQPRKTVKAAVASPRSTVNKKSAKVSKTSRNSCCPLGHWRCATGGNKGSFSSW